MPTLSTSALLSIVLAAGAPTAFTKVVPLREGVAISVESTVGDVEIRAWNRPELSIEIESPAAIEPRVDEGPASIRISAVQPAGGM
ncbi:MAG TPA: hypothetical protein VHJ77_18705, partial [Vicinamibacterales bacterium]|nr:hypothetical protein [Vicinamibacterales bacterium]